MIKSLIKKEFLQIFRQKEMIMIIFIVPILQLLILANAITYDVKNIKLCIFDYDRSSLSRQLSTMFGSSKYFTIADTGHFDARYMLDSGMADIALTIPVDFSSNITKQIPADIQLLMDAQNANLAGIAAAYAQGIIKDFADKESSLKKIISFKNSAKSKEINLHTSILYNPELKSQIYMVPAIAVILLFIVTCLLPALGIVREREAGTFEQLVVTPVKKYQLILGKVIPFIVLGLFEMAVVLGIGTITFSVPFRGSVILLLFTALIFIFSTSGLGIFISTVSKTQQQALFTTWFFMVFGILMSGFFTPIENMPQILQKVTYLNPLRYFMRIIRDIFLKGSNFWELQSDILYLALFGILMFTLSWIRFSKTVS
ncbi:MAG: hypothetical protein A2161_02980 [Candidatus Schekmanbacteria bacterium RBG_13_48_7]|uniref:ABC transmembrane type-2 domain-containing protein n=1 Tax=Candidatus Schekmanbacteria bacterium RBG_13_48_7 TaxID=1817878 RepID=A0A1F7RXU6_9BACT|nr:MAG: hypothetical protein A2161_02980 [Candidatus Schekmanbacteria bacterium RBG_13_48_7]